MTTKNKISCSAPGSLMLLGEHAVLHGRRALVCAIDQRITVECFQTLEKTVRIFSDLGMYESSLDPLEDHPDFRFVLDAVKQYPQENGIELKITSDFSSDIGFGSSAAVTVATHAALMKLSSFVGQASLYSESLCPSHAPEYGKRVLQDLFKRSLATVHRVQGRGLGADVAASVFGGVVAYCADPLEINPICEEFPLTAVYSGSKMKTVDVIRHLEERRALNPDYFEKIFDRMDASVETVERALRAHSERARSARSTFLERLGGEVTLNQKLMEEMGLCNDALAEIISLFQGLEIPAKISGSGLGDCAIGLGKFPGIGTFPTYALHVTTRGVSVEVT